MKTSKSNNKLELKKNAILELNKTELLKVNGGTSVHNEHAWKRTF